MQPRTNQTRPHSHILKHTTLKLGFDVHDRALCHTLSIHVLPCLFFQFLSCNVPTFIVIICKQNKGWPHSTYTNKQTLKCHQQVQVLSLRSPLVLIVELCEHRSKKAKQESTRKHEECDTAELNRGNRGCLEKLLSYSLNTLGMFLLCLASHSFFRSFFASSVWAIFIFNI